MKITVLAENTSYIPGIGCEHGLSLYIETMSKKILFDTGQSNLFEKNAEKLDIDLAMVDFAVLSHGHYDHSGGLKRFLEINTTAPVYLSRYAFEPHYNADGKYIGVDESLSENSRLVFTDEEYRIGEGLTLFSCNNRKRIIDTDCAGLSTLENGKLVPEDFRHEQYLLIEENGKRILISGCSHKGIINIVNWFSPDTLIGGFHYMKLNPGDGLKAFAVRLNSYPTKYYTCHCTGIGQYEFMKPYIDDLEYISSGRKIEL
jgi:7,8-dihydropterin-6-yl-methyl-4-(beta-D-ribofuranosyl)aminobenzene 5'-phosphate synthase